MCQTYCSTTNNEQYTLRVINEVIASCGHFFQQERDKVPVSPYLHMLELLQLLKRKDALQEEKTAAETNIASTPNQAYLDAYTASMVIIQNNFRLLVLIYESWDNSFRSVARTATDKTRQECEALGEILEDYKLEAITAISECVKEISIILQQEPQEIRMDGQKILQTLKKEQNNQIDFFHDLENFRKYEFIKFTIVFKATSDCYKRLCGYESLVIDQTVSNDIEGSIERITERISIHMNNNKRR